MRCLCTFRTVVNTALSRLLFFFFVDFTHRAVTLLIIHMMCNNKQSNKQKGVEMLDLRSRNSAAVYSDAVFQYAKTLLRFLSIVLHVSAPVALPRLPSMLKIVCAGAMVEARIPMRYVFLSFFFLFFFFEFFFEQCFAAAGFFLFFSTRALSFDYSLFHLRHSPFWYFH